VGGTAADVDGVRVATAVKSLREVRAGEVSGS